MLGDKIEFPLNNEMYLKQAVEHIENNEYKEALIHLEKVYETDKSYYVNHFYTLVLYTLENFRKALEIANEHKNSYLENDHHILMYTMLLIKNHQFLEAEVIIQQHEAEPFSVFNEEWENIERELDLEREQLNFEMEVKRKETKRQLFEMSDYSLQQQSQLLQDAHILTLEDLQEVSPQIFSNPFVSGQTQRAFLEILIEMGDENKYMFSWFNQVREICPNELLAFNQIEIVKNVEDILESKLHKMPSLIEGIKTEIINDLLLLYPFIDETVTDIDYWVDLYIAQFISNDQQDELIIAENKEQEKLQNWVQYLNQIAQRE